MEKKTGVFHTVNSKILTRPHPTFADSKAKGQSELDYLNTLLSFEEKKTKQKTLLSCEVLSFYNQNYILIDRSLCEFEKEDW